jgi:hypothetical protein
MSRRMLGPEIEGEIAQGGHPRDLVGERDRRDLRWPPGQQCREPGPMFGAMDLGIADDGQRARASVGFSAGVDGGR